MPTAITSLAWARFSRRIRTRSLLPSPKSCRSFNSVVSASKDGAATVAAMAERYPHLGNPYTLWLAAYTQPYDG